MAVATTAAVVGTTAAAPPVASTMPVALSALIAVGSSTNPTGAGVTDFFQGRFNPPGTDVSTVNFFSGPQGIHTAIVSTGESDVVLSSGWGAANASALLSWYQRVDPADPVVTDNVWVLDNNVARPNGGWGTRYPVFALIGVNPVPTPQLDGARIIDIGYQYDANSNAPAYFLNPIADLNSLVAYTQRRLNQADLYLPVQDDGSIVDVTGQPVECVNTCTVAVGQEPDGTTQYAEIKQVGDTTYVTYLSNGLPLVQPLRGLGPAGSALADALEPIATVLVNAGYPDNNPTANPDRYAPGSILPPPHVIGTAARQLPGAIADGWNSLKGATATTDTEERPDGISARIGEERPAVAVTKADRDAAAKRRPSLNFSTRVSADVNDAPTSRPRSTLSQSQADPADRTGDRVLKPRAEIDSAAPATATDDQD